MHPFSVLTIGIFVAGYITARWDLVTRLYELAIFAWDHGVWVRHGDSEIVTRRTSAYSVQTRAAKGAVILTFFFFALIVPIERIAAKESDIVSSTGICLIVHIKLTRFSTPAEHCPAFLHANS